MESIAKAYKVKFVVDVAQLGEEDPLWQNGSLYFQALKIPWYACCFRFLASLLVINKFNNGSMVIWLHSYGCVRHPIFPTDLPCFLRARFSNC
jgi:hypothetical protein